MAVGDLFPDAAKAKAEKHGIAVSGGPEVVLDHPDVELVVNLTIPAAHAEVALQAINAGKHVWNEKPLALDRVSAKAPARSGRGGRSAGRLRAGHVPRQWAADGPQHGRGAARSARR